MPDRDLDAFIAAVEHPVQANTTDPQTMEAQHQAWLEAGLLDPDQPTPWSHHIYRQTLMGDFTSVERARIRIELGLVPDA